MSGDTEGNKLNLDDCFGRLKKKTRRGDIVLFHSCIKHANETRKILPIYLGWLCANGYKCKVLS